MLEKPNRSRLIGPLLVLAVSIGAVWLQRDLDVGIFPIVACPAGTEEIGGTASLEIPSHTIGIWGESTERPSDPSNGFCRARGVAAGTGGEPDAIEEWQTPADLPVRLADGRLVHAPRASWTPFRGAPIDNERAKQYRAGSSFRSNGLTEECLGPGRAIDVQGCLAPDGTLSGRTTRGPIFFVDGRHTTQAAFWAGLLACALALASVFYAKTWEARWLRQPRHGGLALLGSILLLVAGLYATAAPWALWLATFVWLRLVWQVVRDWTPSATLRALRQATTESFLRGHFVDDLETRQRAQATTAAFAVHETIYTLHEEDLTADSKAIAFLADGELFVSGAALVESSDEYRAGARPTLGRLSPERPIGVFEVDPIPQRRAELRQLQRHRALTAAVAALGLGAAAILATLIVRLIG